MNAEIAQGKPVAPVKAGWILLAVVWLCFVLPVPGIGLFVGWPLNLAAFVVAIVVMTRGRTGPGIAQLLASLIVSPIIYFIGLAILGAAVVGAADEAATARVSRGSAAIYENADKISARELFREYQDNEVAADRLFKGKPLRVDGTVTGISKDAFEGIYVELRTGNEFMSVRAKGLPEASAADIRKGDQVALLCVGGGMLIGSPVLEKCSVAE